MPSFSSPAGGALTPRQTALLLASTCLAWAAMVFLSAGNLDSYHDMLENYAWSQSWLWGTHKHPPLFGWVAGLWFALFPQTDWAYRLLSFANVAVGLMGVWALGRRLGLGRLAPWGALLLLWSFPYTTLAGKFNANSQLLSLWPWTAALLLASWQEKGARGLWCSVWLGLLAAGCMLAKYYSGTLLAGFLLPVCLHPEGRRWLATPRPYLALAVFVLALAPHVAWMASNDWATLSYAADQGAGAVSWSHVLRFALTPLFYWLPAWLCVGLLYATAHVRLTGQAPARTAARFLRLSWQPQGRGDVLFWLSVMPGALTLLFGMAGVVELSTPWAIPIGYTFALLWLRNLDALSPHCTAWVLARLRRAWWPVLAVVLVLGAAVTARNAFMANTHYYRPAQLAAQAIVQAWQQRHPGRALQWVGGEWAENAMLAFYAQPGLRTVPGLPDSVPAQLGGLGDWRQQEGLLLCPLGPSSEHGTASECTRQAQAWLQAQGLAAAPHLLRVERAGWLFPQPQVFVYAVFDVPAAAPRKD